MKTTKTTEVVQQLNQVLANLQVVYQNFRTLHWFVKGPDFFVLHNYFESAYNEVVEQVDEVAERVLMLGGTPDHQLCKYVEKSTIPEVTYVPKGKETLKLAVEFYSSLLNSYSELMKLATEISDEGTAAMFSEYIVSTEKRVWMLKTTLME